METHYETIASLDYNLFCEENIISKSTFPLIFFHARPGLVYSLCTAYHWHGPGSRRIRMRVPGQGSVVIQTQDRADVTAPAPASDMWSSHPTLPSALPHTTSHCDQESDPRDDDHLRRVSEWYQWSQWLCCCCQALSQAAPVLHSLLYTSGQHQPVLWCNITTAAAVL